MSDGGATRATGATGLSTSLHARLRNGAAHDTNDSVFVPRRGRNQSDWPPDGFADNAGEGTLLFARSAARCRYYQAKWHQGSMTDASRRCICTFKLPPQSHAAGCNRAQPVGPVQGWSASMPRDTRGQCQDCLPKTSGCLILKTDPGLSRWCVAPSFRGQHGKPCVERRSHTSQSTNGTWKH